jgi:SagB-type dehydrogenase family enzyme
MLEVQELTIRLPAPRLKGRMSIEEAIAARRSKRAFRSDPVRLADAGQLLWAAQGITDPEEQKRAAPSAGALYPLEVYLVATQVEGLAPGVYRYRPEEHDLVLQTAGRLRSDLAASIDQDCIRFATCVLVFAAVYERTAVRFGERTVCFVHMEAAHAAENVQLQGTALGLGSVMVGAFKADEISRILGLPEGQETVYLMAVGKV